MNFLVLLILTLWSFDVGPNGFKSVSSNVEQLHFIKGKVTKEHTLVCWQFVVYVLKRYDGRVQRKFREATGGVIIWIEHEK